jgi:anti-sigma regulatory factor (Ser/Thr protein kinase)
LNAPEPSFRRSFPADRTAPAVARRAVTDFLCAHGADPRALADVLLAVSEVVTNSVVHGYRGQPGGEVAVEGTRLESGIQLSVSDSGGGMAPRHDSPGLGLGLPLVGQIAQRVDISARAGGGTQVSMCFTLD